MSIVAVSAWSATFVVILLNLGFLGLLIGLCAQAPFLTLVLADHALVDGSWFIDHAGILRYFILFIGIMSLYAVYIFCVPRSEAHRGGSHRFYVIWDFTDDVM